MHDDEHLIDDDRLTDLMPEAPAPILTRLGAQLLIGEGSQRRSVVIEGRTLVGSSPEAAVTLSDPTVSRLHCVLEPRDDGVWVVDLGSRNGTCIDQVRVREARAPDGAVLQLGTSRLVLKYEREPRAVELWPTDRFGEALGTSLQMRELFAVLARLASSQAAVLIQGETGTGKEVLARSLHLASPRADGPFEVFDCAAVPESLIESELFGHARGAFTGATETRLGTIEAASGGTLFLDEIGELPLQLQPRLLRAIESQSVRRVGENSYRRVDVRFVSATHRDLLEMVSQGSFREDLYFRLAVFPLRVPPLRERPEDVPLLVEHLQPGAPLGADLLAELRRRPWPGNVRELRNTLARVMAFGRAGLDGMEAPRAGRLQPGALPEVPLDVSFKELRESWLDHLERTYLEGMLERHGRSLARIAEAAGIDRSYVHKLMRKHGL